VGALLEELINSINALQESRRNQGEPVAADDIDPLEHWLTGPILGADMDLGTYFSEVM
jgi:hypothetical protein